MRPLAKNLRVEKRHVLSRPDLDGRHEGCLAQMEGVVCGFPSLGPGAVGVGLECSVRIDWDDKRRDEWG